MAASSSESLISSFALVGMAVPLYYFTYRGKGHSRTHCISMIWVTWDGSHESEILVVYEMLQFLVVLIPFRFPKNHSWAARLVVGLE